jgi:uroporphyrinogen-III synthase
MTSNEKLRVVSLESRNAPEMARLLERHGCEAIIAPSLREVALADQHEAFDFGEQLLAGHCDVIVLLTGVGARMLVEALATRFTREEIIAAMARVPTVCRGPKPVAALKALGLRARVVAPEPNTSHEVLQAIDANLDIAGKRVFVQEYGRRNQPLLDGLRARGAEVNTVAVYAWQMPIDVEPLRDAARRLCKGGADAVMFTSARQSDHLFEVAEDQGLGDELRRALANDVLVVSIGPTTSESLKEAGLSVDLEPVHPKMGHVVLAIARDGMRLVNEKRSRMPRAS